MTTGISDNVIQPDFAAAEMTLPDGRAIHLVGATERILVSIAERIDATLGAESIEVADSLAPDFQQMCLEAREHLQKTLGSLPILEALATLQVELSPDLNDWRESEIGLADTAALLEVVAIMALGTDTPPQEAVTLPEVFDIDILRAAAVNILQLSLINAMHSTRRCESEGSPLSQLAVRLSAHERIVRGRQFSSIAETINMATLTTPQADAALSASLGFKYAEILTVRTAILGILEDRSSVLATSMERLLTAARSDKKPTGEEEEDLHQILNSIPISPASFRTISEKQVVERSKLNKTTVHAVLNYFSVSTGEMTCDKYLERFIAGHNPFRSKQLIPNGPESYFVLTEGILIDEIRRTCEESIKPGNGDPKQKQQQWARYGGARDRAAEELALKAFRQLLGPNAEMHPGIKYRSAAEDHDLSISSITHTSADPTEADLLCLVDGVVVCVEVKAGGFRDQSRRGGTAQLKGDLSKTITGAAHQAQRLETLIRANGGLWLADGTWFDIPRAREFHQIVICLDDLGPLALNAQSLAKAKAISEDRVPWIVSMHDLLVIQQALETPHIFLSFLRRRTTAEAAQWIQASDELDLLMWFLGGGLFFEPDPDRIFANHPKSRPPTSHDRKTYQEQGITFVHTLTDPLDAYVYWQQGDRLVPAPRPARPDLFPPFNSIVALMAKEQIAGWLRAAADLESLNGKAQQDIANHIEAMLRLTRADGQLHTTVHGSMDDQGRRVFIFASAPDTPEARNHLSLYLRAKKHSDGADRALAVLFDLDASPRYILWGEGRPDHDPYLDQLAREMRLIPPDRAPRCVPPRAKLKNRNARRRKKR